MEINESVKKKDACGFLGIDSKDIDNLAKAGELHPEQIRRRWYFHQTELSSWKASKDFRTVLLGGEDYIKCLNFGIKAYYSGSPKANFGTRTQREVGQFLYNQIQGKLGELALQKFLKAKFGIEIKLDFDILGYIPGQDISEVRRGRVANPARIRVGIKSTKVRNMFLAVPENEVSLPERSSDVYVLVRVGLFPNHLLRFAKDFEKLGEVRGEIPDFQNIPAEIAGFAKRSELDGPSKAILGQDLSKPNYYKVSGELHRSESDWKSLADML